MCLYQGELLPKNLVPAVLSLYLASLPLSCGRCNLITLTVFFSLIELPLMISRFSFIVLVYPSAVRNDEIIEAIVGPINRNRKRR